MDYSKFCFNGIENLQLLSKEDECGLADIIHGDFSDTEKQHAAGKLSTHNIKFALELTYEFAKKCNISASELIGEALEGLMTAAWKFNPREHDARFTTYARHWIRNGIFKAIHNSYPVHIPNHIVSQMGQMKRIEDANVASVIITDDQWIEHLNITPEALQKIRIAQSGWISLDAPCGPNETGEESHVRDFIEDANSESPDENINREEEYAILHDSLSELDEMTKDIVVSQCMSDDKEKLRELGLKYGVTGERIRQIKSAALKSLKKKIERKRNLM